MKTYREVEVYNVILTRKGTKFRAKNGYPAYLAQVRERDDRQVSINCDDVTVGRPVPHPARGPPAVRAVPLFCNRIYRFLLAYFARLCLQPPHVRVPARS